MMNGNPVWTAKYKDGTIIRNGKLKKEGIVKFTLNVNNIEYIVRLDESEELVYFKRVFYRFPNIIEKTLYCLGKKGKNVIWIDGITGKVV